MIKTSSRRVLIALGALLCIGARAPKKELPVELKRVLKNFRSCPGLEARFEEKKHIALLAAPLTQRGKIYFYPPNKLARLTTEPRPSHIVLSGNRVIARDESGRRSIDLSDKPSLRELVHSILHVLAGNELHLMVNYKHEFSGSSDKTWSLKLVPRNEKVLNMVRSFSFLGKRSQLHELHVLEANGDKSFTRFSKINDRRKFSKSELKKFFKI